MQYVELSAAVQHQSIPPQDIAGDSAFHGVAQIDLHGRASVTLTGLVGGTGPLTGLRLSGAAVIGGSMVAIGADADLNAGAVRRCSPSAYTTATGDAFQMSIDTRGLAQLLIEAKAAAATTMAIEACGG